jgi:hypothetical protein
MLCPVCADDERDDLQERCPRCGAPLRMERPAWKAAVIEGTVRQRPVGVPLPRSHATVAAAPAVDESVRQIDARGASRASLIVRRSALPMALWQRPPVRTLAAASAGAVALTLGLRLLRGWLARRQGARALAAAALPTVAELFRQEEIAAQPEGKRSAHGAALVETIIFVRQVIRRR